MNNKLRQVTDSIHGTIYLSALEAEYISTPYFYRLHDIYQSSTVYMTFPSNRTKRYEHSLGTMEIASNMLFSSISNASPETRERFFSDLHDYYSQIYRQVLNVHDTNALCLQRAYNDVNTLFDYKGNPIPDADQFFKSEIREAYKEGLMADRALDQFQFYPISTTQDRDYSDIRDAFLYRCVMEAVRIVALFHDVGHPPFSHIIEDAINTLYTKIENDPSPYSATRVSSFKESLERFISKDSDKAYHCKMILSQSSLVGAHTHERIGLALIQSTINEVLPNRIAELSKSRRLSQKTRRALVLYEIVVAEFVVAILTEISPFFQSLHKIVDGPVDADRLDYVVRDSVNSGVDWGDIPYKRLIQSCKMFYLKEIYGDMETHFSIAFQKKSADDIIDMLETRYKIFARINYHHRCIKTAAALKACVIDLAVDYLKNDECVCKDIHQLWEALLLAKAGDIGLRIIQWNDSWLVSTLHKALVTINQTGDERYDSIKENLEEILLNRKSYYSLLKRGDDQREFVSKIYKAMDIRPENVEKLNKHEEEKLRNSSGDESKGTDKGEGIAAEEIGTDVNLLFDDYGNALDSLGRLDLFDEIVEDGDLALLNALLPLPAVTLESVFKQTLDKLYNESIIKRYQIYVNKGREKLGIPSHDSNIENIFLYSNHKYEVFNENHSLRGQLEAIQNTVPVINIYYVPSDVESAVEIGNRIIDETAKELGNQHALRLRELFGDAI